jgi:sugar (pentulose or hexulose) kinase
MRILSADFGTSSLKLAVLDRRLSTLASRTVGYGYDLSGGDRVEMAPEVPLKAFVDGMKSLSDYADKVEVVAPCVFCPSLVSLDKDGNSLYPIITHLDRRSVGQARRALEAVGKDAFLRINGNLPFPGGISLTSLLWLRDNHPGIYAKTWKYGHFNTYLHRVLTGRFLIEPTNASFTGLYETAAWGGWSAELCEALGVDVDKLPEIRPSGEVVGGLTRAAAAMTGLKEGIPVLMGANDSSSAAYGAGVVDNGAMLNISGSNEILTIALDRPLPHEKVYLRAHVTRGKWLCLTITVGGGAIEWFRRVFCGEMSPETFYERYLPDLVGRRFGGGAGMGGSREPDTTVHFAPYLAGDRHSIEQRRASFDGITLESGREDFLAAVLVGIMEPIRMALDIYKDRVKLGREIVLTGGLVNSVPLYFKERMFPQFRFRTVDGCTSLGNGRLALAALGSTP